jgi:tRNA dimethylallyltransferase
MEVLMFVIIAGPTGTGKSLVAVELAKRIGGEVISADSMQVYKGMDIGTYKIRKNDENGVPHYMIDITGPDKNFSASSFKKTAEKLMDEIKAKGKIPIIAGGTGLYINAVIRGLFEAKEPDEKLKAKLRQELDEKGLQYLANELKKLDPEAFESMDVRNSRRVLRALGLALVNKKKISVLKKETEKTAYDDKYLFFVLNARREELYKRIDGRVEEMIKAGLIKEVESLMSWGIDPGQTSMQAIGYKETVLFLSGKIEMKEAIELIKKNTRNYAKRQVTWFKRYKEAIWVDATGKKVYDVTEEIVKAIAKWEKQKGDAGETDSARII